MRRVAALHGGDKVSAAASHALLALCVARQRRARSDDIHVGLVVGVVGWPNGIVVAAGHCGRADGRGVRQVARGGGAAHRLHVVAAFVESIARRRRAEDRAPRMGASVLLRRLLLLG